MAMNDKALTNYTQFPTMFVIVVMWMRTINGCGHWWINRLSTMRALGC